MIFVRSQSMKTYKRTLTLLVCGALVITSCVPSDDQINPLIGTWTLKAISCQNCIDKSQIASTTYTCNDSDCNTYTFNTDGSLKFVETLSGTSTAINGRYSISGTTVSLNLDDDTNPTKNYCYTLSGNAMYLKEIVDNNSGKCESTTVLGK